MGPIRRVKPGQRAIPHESLNAAFDSSERSQRIVTAAPLNIVRGPLGYQIGDSRLPGMWVRITGQELYNDGSGGNPGSGSGTGTDPLPSYYSGIQQYTKVGEATSLDLEGGIHFYADHFPLMELSGDADVPDGEILWAWPADDGRGYGFRYNPFRSSDGSGGVGSGCGDNPGGVHGPLIDICCVDGTPFKLYADGTLIQL